MQLSRPKFMGIIFILFGLGYMMIFGIRQVSWIKTTGIVLEVRESKEENNQFYPLVQFQNENGALVEVAIKQSSNRFYYKKDEKIPIIYPSADFRKAKINSLGRVLGFPSIFILVGLIAFLIPNDLWYLS